MTIKIYLELSFSLPESQQEILIAFLSQFGFEGFWEDNDILRAYVDKNNWNENSFVFLKEKFPEIKFSITEIQNQDWNKEWENSIEPILATEKIIVRPSWKEVENTDGKIVITIDPKMSFGTGHHETTRLMLNLIEKYVKPNDFVLDIGTGTGILAIAAIKLDAKKCIAVDNDEWSIENTKENVIVNNVENVIEVFLGTMGTVGRANAGRTSRAAWSVECSHREDQGRIPLAALVFHERRDEGRPRAGKTPRRLRLGEGPRQDAVAHGGQVERHAPRARALASRVRRGRARTHASCGGGRGHAT